ncbi:condensation domain-containing protein, partial [Methylocucumis oryzae]
MINTSYSNSAEALAKRFLALPPDKQQQFYNKLRQQGVDFKALPIPTGADNQAPLSLFQQGLWVLHELDTANTAYHIAGAIQITGHVDVNTVRSAFTALMLRHDSLRSVFKAEDGLASINILTDCDLPFIYHDLTNHFDAEAEAQVLAETAVLTPFALAEQPAWRLVVIKRAEHDYELNLVLHHLIADGWSMTLLLSEFAELYQAELNGVSAERAKLPIRYADYARWQRAWTAAGAYDQQLAYWTDLLSGEQPVIELPYDYPRPNQPRQAGGRITFSLSETANQALATLAQEYQASPFMVLLAGFAVLLYRYSGQTDLRLGLPLATRQRPETQQLIGYLVNTVVFVCRIQGQDSFVSVLSQTKQRLLDAEAHPDVPFEHVVDAINPERRLGQNPLFQILVNHQQITDSLAIHGWHIQSQQLDNRAAQFDLSLDTQQDRHGHINGFFTYASELFAANTIQRLSDAYQHLLSELLAAPEQPIAWHSLVNQDFVSYRMEYLDGTEQVSYVHQRIHMMAQSQPNAIALIDGETRLSYGELERQSNRLAHSLQHSGLKPDDIVGLVLSRTVNSVVAML